MSERQDIDNLEAMMEVLSAELASKRAKDKLFDAFAGAIQNSICSNEGADEITRRAAGVVASRVMGCLVGDEAIATVALLFDSEKSREIAAMALRAVAAGMACVPKDAIEAARSTDRAAHDAREKFEADLGAAMRPGVSDAA